MKAIYETKGKAREYCELACNLYDGCTHGCTYCYAKNRDDFHTNVFGRAGILNALEHDAMKQQKAGDRRPVHLCFTCDPYQDMENGLKLTRQAIEILHKYDIPVMILTKGGARAERDFDLLREGDWFGCTLTFNRPWTQSDWEPHAAQAYERVESLWKAHGAGIKTWASLEPVIDTRQSLDLIRENHSFVDHFKVGKWNHDERADRINWRIFAYEARALLNKLHCDYYLKDDLRRYL